MIIFHFVIGMIFFAFGFMMRYGIAVGLAEQLYNTVPKLFGETFDQYKIRRLLGETSVKLGFFPLLIALVGIFKPESFKSAILLGWICFVIVAVGSVTFMDKTNLFKKLKKGKTL